MNYFALLTNGKTMIVSSDHSDGYTVRPLDSTFESATQQQLFLRVKFEEVLCVDTNMVVINHYKNQKNN